VRMDKCALGYADLLYGADGVFKSRGRGLSATAAWA